MEGFLLQVGQVPTHRTGRSAHINGRGPHPRDVRQPQDVVMYSIASTSATTSGGAKEIRYGQHLPPTDVCLSIFLQILQPTHQGLARVLCVAEQHLGVGVEEQRVGDFGITFRQ